MTYGFILIGFILVVLLGTVGRLANLHTKEFTHALYKGQYDKANAMSTAGTWIFRLNMVVLGAVLWWVYELCVLAGVI